MSSAMAQQKMSAEHEGKKHQRSAKHILYFEQCLGGPIHRTWLLFFFFIHNATTTKYPPTILTSVKELKISLSFFFFSTSFCVKRKLGQVHYIKHGLLNQQDLR